MKDHYIYSITMMHTSAALLLIDLRPNSSLTESQFAWLLSRLLAASRAYHLQKVRLPTHSTPPTPQHSDDTVTRKGIPRPEYTMSILSRN